MALNIPMPDSPGDSLIKGLNAGGNLMHQMMLNKYYSQPHASGDVANAMYVEQLRNQYGENDPRYLNAKRAHELALQGRESLIGYRDVLNQTAGVRNSTPLGKAIAEGHGEGAQDILRRNQARGGVRPGQGSDYGMAFDENGNNIVASDDEVNEIADRAVNNARTPEEREAYERYINKQTSDTQARNTLLRAENLDKTRQSINKEDLTRYSGPKGTLKLFAESLRSSKGNPSQEYLNNQKAVGAASLMADQMRQFYGDSIQPSAMERLRELSNPSAWYKDPKVAQAQWDQLNTILDKETETYRNKGTSPIKLNSIKFENGSFKLGKNEGPGDDSDEAGNPGNEGGSYNLKAAVRQLTQIDPRYTEANIRSTAKATGKSIDQVVNELFQRSVRGK